MKKVDLICCFFEQESRLVGYFEFNFGRFDPSTCWITWNGSTDNGSQQATFHFEPDILWMCSHYLKKTVSLEIWIWSITMKEESECWKVWRLISELWEEFCPWEDFEKPQLVTIINLGLSDSIQLKHFQKLLKHLKPKLHIPQNDTSRLLPEWK